MLCSFAAANLVSPFILDKHFTCHVLNQLKGGFPCMSYKKKKILLTFTKAA